MEELQTGVKNLESTKKQLETMKSDFKYHLELIKNAPTVDLVEVCHYDFASDVSGFGDTYHYDFERQDRLAIITGVFRSKCRWDEIYYMEGGYGPPWGAR